MYGMALKTVWDILRWATLRSEANRTRKLQSMEITLEYTADKISAIMDKTSEPHLSSDSFCIPRRQKPQEHSFITISPIKPERLLAQYDDRLSDQEFPRLYIGQIPEIR